MLHLIISRCSPLTLQVSVGEEVRVTEKVPLDGRAGTCEWTKDMVLRDIASSKELVVEVWATDARE